ncbi:MAG: DUF3536 domain-containing protein [Elusimicrobiales bacterium]|nr:DUF3536 domain-containing protein [Elusimicrobiales bacterium]
MDEKNKNYKYLIIHTHFYQPPRENPYTGEIELDFTAKPYDNWNHRIAMECYLPNIYSRIYNNSCEIIEIIHNISYYNLNWGPTLLNWIKRTYPYYYQKIIEIFNMNKEKYKNFIAQAYNHTILPLDSFLDKIIQITWGIRDFENNFLQKPQGIWLGECAVNEDVLKLLIDNNIEYIILSPHQIATAYDLITGLQKSIIPNVIYRWYDKNPDGKVIKSRYINIITYDDILSKKVAFNNITFNSEIFLKELINRYEELKTNTLIIAVDGETFGHHYKFADLTLAHALKYELHKKGIFPISAYNFIKNTEVYAGCTINLGPDGIGTSWSCEHGIKRWTGGCLCGDEGKYSTEWRKGLRSAINWLSEVVNEILLEEGKNIFIDYLSAIKEYIDVINSKISISNFLYKHLKNNNKENYFKAIKILEMFRYKSLSRTSCGWFFNDISRIETQIIMRYAMKSIELAEELGYKGIEKGFISLLELAPSNFQQFKNGKEVYEKLVKTSKMNEEKVLVYLTAKNSLLGKKIYHNTIYRVTLSNISQDSSILKANVNIEKVTGESFNFLLEIDFTSIEKIKFKKITELDSKEFYITDFNNFTQIELLKLILNIKKAQNIDDIEKILESLIETAQIYPSMAIENLYEDINHFFKSVVESYLIMFIKSLDKIYIQKIEYFITKLEKVGFKINFNPSNDIIIMMPDIANEIFSNKFSIKEIEKIDLIFKKLSLHHFYFHTQNKLYDIKKNKEIIPS